MKYTAVVAALAATVSAADRSNAPSGAITVCASGCKYNTIQGAVSSLSKSSTSAQSIFIKSGTYTEQVTVPALKGKLNIYGQTKDTSDYKNNVVNLQWKSALNHGASDDEHTAALINTSPNVAVYNINIKNTYGKGAQAIALSAYGTKQGYYGVGLYGYQDTLLAQTGNQIYSACYIQGATDFIFGQTARAWITKSVIAPSAAGCITADGRDSDSNQSFYVIDSCTITAASGSSVGSGTVYLGRPWRNYARVTVQKSSMSGIINSAGWSQWSSSSPNTDHVQYQEYSNTGSGASGKRANFSKSAGSAQTIGGILGSDYGNWVDAAYV